MPLPLPGPMLEVHCAHCQETNHLEQDFWRELLDGVDTRGELDAVPDGVELDVRREKPPEALREQGARTPQWLQPLVPAARMFFGACLDSSEDGGNQPNVYRASAKPVLMTCPLCAGSIKITGETSRTCTCQYCSSEIYLPNDLWCRLHPVKKATYWYVEFAGERAQDRKKRLSSLQDRLRSLKQQRAFQAFRFANPLIVICIAAVFGLPISGVSCVVGEVAAGDSLFGAHARVFCPLVCDYCTGPYITYHVTTTYAEYDEVYCTSGSGRVKMPQLLRIASWFFPWLVYSVLLLPVVCVCFFFRDRRAQKQLPALDKKIAQCKSELEEG